VKIKEPLELQNLTVGQRLLSMDWSNPKVSKSVEDVFHLEKHNSLCLAHGRKPIAPYLASMYPKFKSIEKIEDFKCAITAPQASSVVRLSNSVLSYYFALAYLLVQQ